MSRAMSGDTVTIKPGNSIYTALAAAGVVVVLLGIIALFVRANTLFGGNGLF